MIQKILRAKSIKLLKILMFMGASCVFIAGFSAPAKANPKYASIVMDANTGLILYQRYADKRLHPASLTKVMTLLLAFEALQRGEIRLSDRIHISRHAANMVPSKLGLPAGSSIRVQDAIYALVTKSANDVAVALAEHIGQSESQFAVMMTRKAREIGMNRTVFRNASGLHDSRQVSTARDMAKMARYVINEFPREYKYFSKTSFSYNGKSYRNHNRLMASYRGMDGMKTGYINASGFNLISSAVRDNERIIGVVFGGRTSRSRNAHMAKILDSGFSRLGEIRMARAKAPLPNRKPGVQILTASLNDIDTETGQTLTAATQNWAYLNPSEEEGFGRLIGEGDFDPGASDRIRTGLMAIHAHKGHDSSAAASYVPAQKPAAYQTASLGYPGAGVGQALGEQNWAIQVGAFKSRTMTERALYNTKKDLPASYAQKAALIAPLKTTKGWIFRARFTGFTEQEARHACNFVKECLAVTVR